MHSSRAASAALSLLGTPLAHDKVPWFWSDQYDLKIIIVGLNHGYDTLVMRGAPGARSFSACYLLNGELIAIAHGQQPQGPDGARS